MRKTSLKLVGLCVCIFLDAVAYGWPNLALAAGADSIMGSAQESRRLATCISGFVWREASWMDLVCVPPASRDRAAQENQLAASRRAGAGAYGPDTCKPGFVWREAFASDRACVPPAARTLAAQENALASQRRIKP